MNSPLFCVPAAGLGLVLLANSACLAQDPFAPKPPVPAGFVLVGGDILVPEHVLLSKSAFSPNPADYWPSGVVPFEFDANVTQANQAAMVVAMQQWEGAANVQFVARTTQNDYVHIQNSTGNNSSIGRRGGEQIINIVSWGSTFIIAHELGHCLGFDHTMARTNRDDFITINLPNIQPAFANQFDVHVGFNDYGPYDFDSVMEYDQCAFSIDCAAGFTCNCLNLVITVKPPNDVAWQNRIGQRTHLSTLDKLIMSFLYPQPDWRFVDGTYTGAPQLGTFLNPFTTFAAGESSAPSGGTVWMLQPGNYFALGSHSKPMSIKAPLGGVTLGK
jgi:hypothetical protein